MRRTGPKTVFTENLGIATTSVGRDRLRSTETIRSVGIRAILFVCCVFCLQLASCSRTSPDTSDGSEEPGADLLQVKVSGKWGYVNGRGKLAINPQFDAAEEFHEGRAAVCVGKPCDSWDSPGDSRWGYIDASGKLVVTPQYASASSFSEGLASVCTGDCTGFGDPKPLSRGYINRDGTVVIPMQFGIASDFKEGLAQVCIGKCSWEKNSGYDGKFGFIDHSGHFAINPQYDNANDFKNGFASVTVGKGNDARSGFIDKTGTIVWQPSNWAHENAVPD